MNAQNYYEILGITNSASLIEIKKAYVQKVRQFPNEKYPHEFQLISKAYKTLTDEESRQKYNTSIQGNGSYQNMLDKVNEHINREEYSQALSLAEQCLKNYPDNYYILYLKAHCLHHLKEYSEAEKILTSLVMVKPDKETYVFELASHYFSLEKYEKAKQHYEKLIELNPKENNYHLYLSYCYSNLEQYKDAISVLENGLSEKEETVYDFPLFSELYFLTSIIEKKKYHARIIDKIKQLPRSAEEQNILLDLMVDLVASLQTEHSMFKELVSIIKDINNEENHVVTEWIKQAEGRINPNLVYYGDELLFEDDVHTKDESHIYNKSSSAITENIEIVENGRGSVFWAIVFGIILSIAFKPLIGIIFGVIWYFNGKKLKKFFSWLGCLAIILFVFVLIINAL